MPRTFFFFFSFALQFRRSTMICWDHMFTIPELGLLYPNKTSTGPQISWMVNFFCSFCSFFHFLQDIAYLNFPWNPPLHLYCSFFFLTWEDLHCVINERACAESPLWMNQHFPVRIIYFKSNEKTCCCSSSSSQNTAQTIIEEALFQSVCCLVSIICCFNK
jgi:hypothetical protein